MSVRRDSSADALEAMVAEQQRAQRQQPPQAGGSSSARPAPRRGVSRANEAFASDLDEAITVIGLLVNARTQAGHRRLAAAVTSRLKVRAAQLRGR